jgi:branched-subunit amino acid ABC-type transport system permease component
VGQAIGLLLVNLLSAAVYGSLLALVSFGLTLVFGLGRVVNFATGVFYALGAYLMLTLLPASGYWAAMTVAPVLVGLIGFFVEQGIIRPIRGRPEIYTLLATFALAITLTGLIQTGWDPRPRLVDPPILGAFQIFGGPFPKWRVYAALIAVMGVGLVWLGLYTTDLGLRIRAASDNRLMASLLGLNTFKVLTATFSLSCGMAALAGALAGPIFSVRATMGNDLLVDAFLAVIVGGLGSLRGAVVGAYLIAMMKNLPIGWLEAEWASIAAFALVVFVMLTRPAGVFGEGRVD